MAKLLIPIVKGKAPLEIDTDESVIPTEVYEEALIQGFKVLLNRSMSKISKETYPNAEELKAAALAKAAETYEDLKKGKVRRTSGTKTSKVTGKVKTEAMRLARNLVKDQIKAAGGKISHYEASEITKVAKALLESEQGKSLMDMAAANIAEREKAPVKIDIGTIVVSEKRVAKANEKAAKAKTLSAAKAGQVQAKAKLVAQPTA